MFNVILFKQVHAHFGSLSSEDIILQKEFKLPFAPYEKLRIKDGAFHEEITGVAWINDKSRFECETFEDKEIYNAELAKEPHRQISEIVEEYQGMGWNVRANKRMEKTKKSGV